MAKLSVIVCLFVVLIFGWMTMGRGAQPSDSSTLGAGDDSSTAAIEVRGSAGSSVAWLRRVRWIVAASIICAGITIASLQLRQYGSTPKRSQEHGRGIRVMGEDRPVGRRGWETTVLDEIAAD